MARQLIDLTGKRFGRWTVLEHVGHKSYNHEAAWRCRCDCGRYSTVASSDLRRGTSKGCKYCSNFHRRKENIK